MTSHRNLAHSFTRPVSFDDGGVEGDLEVYKNGIAYVFFRWFGLDGRDGMASGWSMSCLVLPVLFATLARLPLEAHTICIHAAATVDGWTDSSTRYGNSKL